MAQYTSGTSVNTKMFPTICTTIITGHTYRYLTLTIFVNRLQTKFEQQIDIEIANNHTHNILYVLNMDLNLVTCNNLYKQYTLTKLSRRLGSALEFNNSWMTQ